MNIVSTACRIFLLCIVIASPLLLTGCDDEPVDATASRITGTWYQQSYTIDGQAVAKDSTRMLIQINSDQICILCDSTRTAVSTNKIIRRSGWSYTGGRFNLAIDLPVSWEPTLTDQLLTLSKTEFSTTGSLVKSTLVYRKVASIEIN
ncbi:MAG: hypothetical protein BGP01_07625 [Paludibacter sp. 47-17]|jgi:hypothetical protein|nr:MAG: hypothetical protein F9K10_01285 [Paludibacter sp.]OJX92473.1 MAG: hypothetical protein BGP01_07625 [Paludibacter sp. 47-17]